MLLNQPKGITALTLTLLGYAVGMARQYIVSPSPLVPTIVVAIATALGMAFYEVVSFLLGQFEATITYARQGRAAHRALQRGAHTDPLPPPATHS